jgi:hypothetical protein
VELGAHWIHGILGNPLYELALRNVKYYYHYSLYGSPLIAGTFCLGGLVSPQSYDSTVGPRFSGRVIDNID